MMLPPGSAPPGNGPVRGPAWQWDIFCRVIDNFGDIGVCWRLACCLVRDHGQRVRLWVDDASSLAWMAAPDAGPRPEVLAWPGPQAGAPPGDVLLETFGCEPPAAFRARAGGIWINLEHLSAEDWVARCHRLPSPIMAGPGAGRTRWFFYPGFTRQTGGLLREADQERRQRDFSAHAWRARLGIRPQDWAVALFCYDRAVPFLRQLPGWLEPPGSARIHLLATPGHAHRALHAALHGSGHGSGQPPALARLVQTGRLIPHALPACSQPRFDELLQACDLNLVRGEDSLVRALWAGQPFVWHIYAQADRAHHAKLHAFLDWLDAPQMVRAWMLACCDLLPPDTPVPRLDSARLRAWQLHVQAARAHLAAQPDLATQLLAFAREKQGLEGRR